MQPFVFPQTLADDVLAKGLSGLGFLDAIKDAAQGAKEVINQATQVASEVKGFTDVWDTGDITVPSYATNTRPDGSNWPAATNAKQFLENVAQGATYRDDDWAAFGLTPPNMATKPKGEATWDPVNAQWKVANKYKPKPPVPQTAKQTLQAILNGYFGTIPLASYLGGGTGVIFDATMNVINGWIDNGQFSQAVNGLTVSPSVSLTSLIVNLTNYTKRAAEAGLSVTAPGPYKGKSAKDMLLMKGTQLAQLIARLPEGQRPKNTPALAQLLATESTGKLGGGSSTNTPATTKTGGLFGGGGGGGIVGIGLLLLLLRAFA